MYIDTHAHLTDGAFDHDRQELIKGLAAGGIGKIIEISCDPKDFPVSVALAEKTRAYTLPSAFTRNSRRHIRRAIWPHWANT